MGRVASGKEANGKHSRMNRRAWVKTVVMLIAAVTVLSGCSVFEDVVAIPKPSDIEGTWTHAGPHGEQASLVFKNDGRLHGQHIPREIFAEPSGFSRVSVDWSKVQDLDGSWAIPGTRMAGNPTIYVNLDQTAYLPRTLTAVYLARSGGKLYVYAPVGDADNDQVFTFYRDPTR